MDDLLDVLLGVLPPSPPPKLVCEIDTKTTCPIVGIRRFGGYTRPAPREVTVCDSLCIRSNRDYEDMIEDMTRQGQMRSKLLAVEKRASRYDRAMKKKEKGHK
jgi:hypothetical protein